MSEEEYSLQALESDLSTLALKLNEIDNLDQTVDQFYAAAAVQAIPAAGFGFAGAAGATAALTATGTGVGAAGSLISSAYGFEQACGQIEGKNREDLLESISSTLSRTEETVSIAGQEIRDDLETIRSQWGISQIAIPAPPGSDEVSGDSFYHESAY